MKTQPKKKRQSTKNMSKKKPSHKAKKKATEPVAQSDTKLTEGAEAVLTNRTCPCCKKHCPLAKPKCSKGKAIRKKLLANARTKKADGTK